MNLEETEAYLKACEFFRLEGRDYKHLRRQYSKNKLTQNEEKNIQKFSYDLLQLAIKGLQKRKMHEEKYLISLY